MGEDAGVSYARGPLPTHRLLRDRGHSVTSTESLDEAIEQMDHETVDLLIIEQPERSADDFEHKAMEKIQSLPLDQQPRDVAFIALRSDVAERMPSLIGPRVHVLLKPLHVHAMLHMLRNLEKQAI